MKQRGARLLTAGLLAGAGLLEMNALLNPGMGWADDTALIMGYTETPNPLPVYVNNVETYFLNPNPAEFAGQPTYPDYSPLVVQTNEGADYAQAISQGSAQLNTAIEQALSTPGSNAVVWGYSESTSIATQELINLTNEGSPNAGNLQFVLLEDLNNPNGGFLERFPQLAGTPFPATPVDTAYQTSIYTVEYSGSSDFPEYASNILADENAMDGFVDLHPLLLPGYPSAFDFSSLANTVTQATDGNTTFYMIPTQNLPLLDLTRDLGGSAYADLMQPDMRVIVDLGYDWTSDPGVATPAVFTAPTIDTTAVDAYLAAGADQGVIAALVDYGILPSTDLSDMYPYVPDVAGLDAGALTNDAAAQADALASANALTADLAASSNPLASELSAYLPGLASDLASSFENMLPSL